jgi:RNA 2',3'-cyclic 3'-phosphodiesterase
VNLRLFTAIELTDEARERLAGSIATLRQSFREANLDEAFRWVATGNLHLTLRFLGNIPEDAAHRLIEAMQAPIRREPVRLVLGRLGAFPARGRPRVLHAAVEEGADAMRELRADVDARLAPLHTWEVETRPFAPHLTLARARDGANILPGIFSGALESVRWPAVPFHAAAVTLFSSRTLPSGPEYTIEARAALRSE